MVEEKQRILVIEDEDSLALMYQELLKDAGYKVVLAFDGQQGLKEIKRGGFDLILLDIMMPGTDGFGVMQLMDDDDWLNNGPVVILTNIGQEANMAKAFRFGASGYLVKSDYDPPQILEKVKEFIERGGGVI